MTGYESLIDSLKAFIKSDHPEVICLFGAWGTGKTFAWDRALFECGGRENLLYYSYASIFGLTSNEEVKREIVINSSIQGERNIKVPKRLAEKFGPLARAFGGGNAYDAIQEVLFSEIPKGVICIDDIERANSLSIEALMGLAAQLRDQKHCRVCLILNLDNLSSDARQHWDTYQEKSIDRTLAFDPVAPSGSSLLQIDEACDSAIVTHVDRLGIKNIRIIKRIQRDIKNVEKSVGDVSQETLSQIRHSLSLFIWAKLDGGNAPPIDFLKSYNFVGSAPKENGEDEAKWADTLKDYGYLLFNELDEVLLDFVTDGIFDADRVRIFDEKNGKNQQKLIAEQRLQNKWDEFRWSFKSKENLLPELADAAKAYAPWTSPNNLSATIEILRLSNDASLVDSVLSEFRKANGDRPASFWDLRNHSFADSVHDPEVIAMFDEQTGANIDDLDPEVALRHIADKNSWGAEHSRAVQKINVDWLVEKLCEYEGDSLREFISGLLNFRNIANPEIWMTELNGKAVEAFTRIASQNDMNAERVRRLGVPVELQKERES